MITFDLEVSTWPDEGDWDGKTPLGISCAAAAYRTPDGDIATKTWAAEGLSMTPAEVSKILDELMQASKGLNKPIYTWNGGGFDFKVMAIECPERANDIAKLAISHFDGMLMVTAKYGFYLGLDKAAKGAQVGTKLKEVTLNDGTVVTDMSGAKAPEMWAAGERAAVLAYLAQDVATTLEVAETHRREKAVTWTANSGRLNTRQIEFVMVGALPERPSNVSWMKDPKSKAEIMTWAYNLL